MERWYAWDPLPITVDSTGVNGQSAWPGRRQLLMLQWIFSVWCPGILAGRGSILGTLQGEVDSWTCKILLWRSQKLAWVLRNHLNTWPLPPKRSWWSAKQSVCCSPRGSCRCMSFGWDSGQDSLEMLTHRSPPCTHVNRLERKWNETGGQCLKDIGNLGLIEKIFIGYKELETTPVTNHHLPPKWAIFACSLLLL